MNVLIWIANHALWISFAGALCAFIVRFEKSLPKRLHKFLLAFGLFVGFATPLLGLLKKSVDDQWRVEMQRQIADVKAAALPKPFKERLLSRLRLLDPKVIPALQAGYTNFHGMLTTVQIGRLQSLCEEKEAAEFITLRVGQDTTVEMDGSGMSVNIGFTISPALLNP